MTAINRFGFFAIPTRIREVFKSVRFACGFARREIDQSARSRYEIAKESKEAELKKDEDEKAEKESTCGVICSVFVVSSSCHFFAC